MYFVVQYVPAFNSTVIKRSHSIAKYLMSILFPGLTLDDHLLLRRLCGSRIITQTGIHLPVVGNPGRFTRAGPGCINFAAQDRLHGMHPRMQRLLQNTPPWRHRTKVRLLRNFSSALDLIGPRPGSHYLIAVDVGRCTRVLCRAGLVQP